MRRRRPIRLVLSMLLGAALWTGCATTSSDAPVYLVRLEKGDTLAGLAAKYDTTWERIARLNDLKDGAGLAPGQVIRIQPGPGGYAAGAEAVKSGKARRTSSSKAPLEADNELFEEAERTQRGGGRAKRGGLLFGGDDEAALGRYGPDRFRWPVSGEVSSVFGKRGRRQHQGIDIRAPTGTPIAAAASGRVEFAGRQNGYGKIVILRHRISKTAYAHMSRIGVEAGDWIESGQEIGAVGTSGNASGPHLHFEIRRLDNRALDPLTVLPRTDLVTSL